MPETTPPRPRRSTAAVLAVALSVLTLLAACSDPVPGSVDGTGSTSREVPTASSSSEETWSPDSSDSDSAEDPDNSGSSDGDSTGTTISGQVVVRDTGEPYPGVSVEFRNLYGENVHTETDANGEYSLQVPADVYTAMAVDLDNHNAGFDVVGGSTAVSVPPSTRVDFEGYAIVEGYEPVP